MVRFTIAEFFRDQRAILPICAGDVGSKAVMVVGSNVGLGLETAIRLGSLKPKWLLTTCRDEDKCRQTRQVLLRCAGLDKGQDEDGRRVASWPLELGIFSSVRALVDRFAAEAPADGQLNVLIASASMFGTEYATTEDGWELTVQVNYFSMALLSILMLPYLVKSSSPDCPSRLVAVSSIAHHWGAPKLKNAKNWSSVLKAINAKKFCGSGRRYFLTKCLEIIFIRELSARLPQPTPVVACAVNPGFCRSHLFRHLESKWFLRPIMPLLNNALFARSQEEGSRTLIHAAIGDDARAMHGQYLSRCQLSEPDDFLLTPEGKEFSGRLWTETIDVLSQVDGRVPDIVSQYLSG